MASNNYTAANVTPSSDTFREWVDLTNRITYDMEKRVVTTAQHTVGGGTTGNAYVNGFFSANTLMITDSIQGVSTDDSSNIVGANSALANLIFSTNATFIANSTHYSHINAQANVHISGGLLNVDANVDIDNADTDITATDFTLTGTTANLDSTTTAVNGTTLDINSTNVDVDTANAQVNATAFFLEGTTANIESTTLTVNGTLLDINSNVDIDAVTVTVDGGTMTVGSMINANANVDINNALTDITSTDTNISGSNVTIDSTHVDIHGTSLDINSNTNIDGDVTLTANAVVGNANTDLLTVNSDTVLTDKLNVQKAVDFDDVLNVDGAATFNADVTLGNANTDSVNFIAEVSSGISPEANTQALGLDDARWILKANTINASGDITASADVDVAAEANVNSLRVVTDASIEGNTTLGNANTDSVNFIAKVSSSIEPSANGNDLGTVIKRWDLNANGVNVANHAHFNATMNVEDDATFGTDIDVSSEANTQTLRVRSTSKLEGFANAVQSIGVGANVHVGGNTYIHHGNTDGLTTISDSNITIGNSTVNTAITTGGVDTDGSLAVLGAATLSSTLGVGGATSLGSTLNTTGSARFQSTANVDGLLRAKAGLITTGEANASVAMNVGANVNLSTSKITVGSSTANTTITKAAIDTDGTLSVLGAAAVSNTLATGNTTVTGFVTVSENMKAGSANVTGGLQANGATDLNSTLHVQGATTVANTLAIGNTSVTGTLSTSGKASLASANVTGALQANGAVDFNSTGDFAGNVNFQDSITVADDSTFSGTLAAGDTTITGFTAISGNMKAASANVSGHSNVATLGATGAVDFDSTLSADGLVTAKNNLNVTGTANASLAIHVGTSNTLVRLANNDIAVGNAAANSKLTSTTISTTGTLTVSNTAALGTTTITGDASVTGALDATSATVGGLTSTGAVDFDTTLNVDGATTLNGGVTLGNATADILQLKGRANTNFVPSTNDARQLGTSSLRWKGAFSTINASSSGIIGGGLAVNGTTNSTSNTTGTITSAGGLGVKKSATVGEDVTVHGNMDVKGTAQNFGAAKTANITSDASTSTVRATNFIANSLSITGSASLPSDTTLTLAEANAVNFNVVNNANFSTGADVVVNLGKTPAGNVTVNLVNAHFTNTMVLDHRLQVGTFTTGASGTGARLNSTSLEVDNVYARNDLVANYSSDQRLKDKVIKIDTALDKVNSIAGYQFEWNKHIEDFRVGTIDYGVIAQELEKVLPHAVDINNRGYKTVNYNSLIPLLIEAVKELSSRVKELEGDKIDV